MFRWMLIVAIAGEIQAATPAGTEEILSRPVSVRAACAPVDDTASDCTITAAFRHQRIVIETFPIGLEGGVPAALAQIRRTTVWKQGSLFIQSECGGSTSWSCSTEHVFVCDPHLGFVEIGEFIIGEAGQPAESLVGSHFIDHYDKLEDAPLPLSHARRPTFALVLRRAAIGMRVDINATWQLNKKDFDAAARALPHLRGMERDCGDIDSVLVAKFAQPLALAVYCRQSDEVEKLLRRAESIASPEEIGVLKQVFALVRPAEHPVAWRPSANH
jgi:hypothetical protein